MIPYEYVQTKGTNRLKFKILNDILQVCTDYTNYPHDYLIAVKSDKTNRLVVTDEDNHMSKSRALLNNPENYKILDNSKCKSIETQANRIIRNVCKDKLDKRDCQRMISMGSEPAKFTTLIKDHKIKSDSGYPLRPVASTINTPTNKIDWLVSRILNQLLQFIPSYLKNTEHLLDKLNQIEKDQLTNKCIFISLDVINLYPSIPINEAISAVIKFAEKWWSQIDHLGFSLEELRTCLSFISYNYEIQFENKTYVQIKGCPMGAHFSPPFAIIFMNAVEEKALEQLRSVTGFIPTLYARFIDDVILGPVELDEPFCNTILETFNSINKSIQFTMEIPKSDEPMNFLDTSITVLDKEIKYYWFRKPTHSNLLLNEESNLPSHMKKNFVLNMFHKIESRCSTKEGRDQKIQELETILEENNYSKQQIRTLKRQYLDKTNRKKKRKFKDDDRVPLFISFINDNVNRQINKAIAKYDLNIKLISKPAPQLCSVLNRKRISRSHHNCEICGSIKDKKSCKTRYVVYQFECGVCHDIYIGQTARPFHFRYKEHKRAIENKNNSSALSEHILKRHQNASLSINDFALCFLEILRNPVDCKISEAKHISSKNPKINRREELIKW